MMYRRTLYYLLGWTFLAAGGCSGDEEPPPPDRDYQADMKSFVENLSSWAHLQDPGFIIIPQNGHELITVDGKLGSNPDLDYIQAVDGFAREDLFYGYEDDDVQSPYNIRQDWSFMLEKAQVNGSVILAINYCYTHSKMDDAYAQSAERHFVSFSAPSRDLDVIPDYPDPIPGENNAEVNTLDSIRNFLYLLDPEAIGSRQQFIQAVAATNYDMVVTDLFYSDSAFTPAEVEQMRIKANGGKRLVIAYMSIGEAENYRYYWDPAWNTSPPEWLDAENPDWPGNFKVKYWETAWQQIIFGNSDAYLQKILDAGFDGTWLDIIDAFEYFSEKL